MDYLVTQKITCGIAIPDGKSLQIDGFTFLPDFEGERQARHIQATIQANTKEEAKEIAQKLFRDFLVRLTLLDNSKYYLNDELAINQIGSSITTHTVSISMGGFVVKDGNETKKEYESRFLKTRIRKKPLRLYSDAIHANNVFDTYRNYYRVLECYGGTTDITNWIKTQIPKPEMKKNNHGQAITVYTWIRIKLAHAKNKKNDLEPLFISNPDHVELVRKYLDDIQNLARVKIKEEENI